MKLTPQEVALGLGIAVAVGVLVGIERERKAQTDKKSSFGGIRTFPLISLSGALGALLADSLGVAALVLPFAVVGALLVAAYCSQPRNPRKPRLGLTSEVAAVVVFCVGALPFVEVAGLEFNTRLILAGGIGAVVMSALALREPLHRIVSKVSAEDLFATVRFVLLAAVALPLLHPYDRAYGPFDAFNPFNTGVVIVLIAAISFFGYVAVRALGTHKGIGLTAIFGGLASSTAVTLSFSGRAKEQAELTGSFALAIVLASTIMFPRLAIEISVVQAPLLPRAAPALGAMLAAGFIGSAILWWRSHKDRKTGDEPKLNNPFSLKQALRLGIAYAVIRFVAAAAYHYLGSAGLFASAGLAGLTDVDAITLTICQMVGSGKVAPGEGVLAITVAALSNTFTKAGIAFFMGGRRLGLLVAAVLLPAACAGIATAAAMYLAAP